PLGRVLFGMSLQILILGQTGTAGLRERPSFLNLERALPQCNIV
ncbi:MAG: hypothetical protein ACI92S_003407, partial [Planctomycetaceae bacterium]